MDEDAFVHQVYPEVCAKKFPAEFEIIQRAISNDCLYYAFRTDMVLFKESAPEDARKDALKALSAIKQELNQPYNFSWKEKVSARITNQILDLVANSVQKKQNVILDAWYIKADELKKLFPQAKINRVMLYCPLPAVYECFKKRNAESLQRNSSSEYRYVSHLMSFCSLYRIGDRPKQPIEKVDLAQLNRVFV